MTHNWYAIAFGGSYAAAPRFVASMATYSGGNNCALRYRNLATSGVEVKVEEDNPSAALRTGLGH